MSIIERNVPNASAQSSFDTTDSNLYMSDIQNRIKTFQGKWPDNAPVEPNKLARAGFYRAESERSDEVRCFVCDCTVSDWKFSDDAIRRHKTASPNCEFLKRSFVKRLKNYISSKSVFKARAEEKLLKQTKKFRQKRPALKIVLDRTSSEECNCITPSDGNVADSPCLSHPDKHLTSGYFSTPSPDSESAPSSSRLSDRSSHPLANTQHRTNKSIFKAKYDGAESPDMLSDSDSMVMKPIISMYDENKRLRTFTSWPISHITPGELAKAGFFYTNEEDKVQCAFCSGTLSRWQLGEDPMVEHRRHFPRCPYVERRKLTRRGSFDTSSSSSPDDEDVVGYLPLPKVAENARLKQRVVPNLPNDEISNELGIMSNEPARPEYATLESRVSTFRNKWPSNLSQSAEELAEAGFYYCGYSDQVECFFCAGSLNGWAAEDQPWEEHARWFDYCPHVRRVKGVDWVRRVVRDMQPASHSPNEQDRLHINIVNAICPPELDIISSVKKEGYLDIDIYKAIERRARTTTAKKFLSPAELIEEINSIKHPYTSNEAMRRHSCSIGSSCTTSSEDISEESSKENGQNSPQSSSSIPQCKICMDLDVAIVFLPCGHLVSCAMCAPAMKICPVCRELIRGTVKAYM